MTSHANPHTVPISVAEHLATETGFPFGTNRTTSGASYPYGWVQLLTDDTSGPVPDADADADTIVTVFCAGISAEQASQLANLTRDVLLDWTNRPTIPNRTVLAIFPEGATATADTSEQPAIHIAAAVYAIVTTPA